MNLDNVVKYKNILIKKYCNRNSIVVDATMGNGNDTYMLGQVCKNGCVYAFDIQQEAIDNTKDRCHEFSNIKYNLMSHSEFHTLNIKYIDFAIFNLGYLPGSDESIYTKYDSTISALSQMLEVLKVGGGICISIYSGHDQVEEVELLKYISTLSNKKYAILEYKFLNLNNAPYIIAIEKLY